jgi:hypothetical protein
MRTPRMSRFASVPSSQRAWPAASTIVFMRARHVTLGDMSDLRELRCYQYVNRPYPSVRDLLRSRLVEVCQAATRSAASRSQAVAASLRARAVGIDLGVDVRIEVRDVRDEQGPGGSPHCRIALAWQATEHAHFFPTMDAQLSLWPLTATETQLEILGSYDPPLGLVGDAFDAAVGHRIAEATVLRFLDDVVAQIRKELPGVNPQ